MTAPRLTPSSPGMTRREALYRTAALLGIALWPSAISSVLGQSSRDPAAGPRFLSPRRFAVASGMAEALLPRTETPGAKDVGVPQFIDDSYGRFLTPAEKNYLDRLFDRADAGGFESASLAEQQQRLRDWGSSHRVEMRQFRDVVLLGYFTSETVMKTVLAYDPIPMRLEADIPLTATQGRAWAE